MNQNNDNELWKMLFSYREKVVGYLRNYFIAYYGRQFSTDSTDESRSMKPEYNLYEADYENIFQDAVLFICKNTKNGKIRLADVSGSSTYLAHVCLYKMKECLRKQKYDIKYSNVIRKTFKRSKESSFLNEKVENLIALSPESKYLEREKESIIKRMVLSLPSPCDKILEGFYWEEKTIKELADDYYQGNENVVKVTKHRCCEKFRNKFSEQIRKGELHE